MNDFNGNEDESEDAYNDINNNNLNDNNNNQNNEKHEQDNINYQEYQYDDNNQLNLNNKYNEDEIIMDNNLNPNAGYDINEINDNMINDQNLDLNNNDYYMGEENGGEEGEEMSHENIMENQFQQGENDQIEYQDENDVNLEQDYNEINHINNINNNINNIEYDNNLINDNEDENEIMNMGEDDMNINSYNSNNNENLDDNLLYNENNEENINTINSININPELAFNNNNEINEINDLNEIDIMKNNNLNYLNRNNNNSKKRINLINQNNDIESLKLLIINLQNKINFLQNQNQQLKLNSKNRINIDNRKDPNYDIIENSIKQGTILLDDVKRKNYNLNNRIKNLEIQNQQLNYQLIETNQKLSRMVKDQQNLNINNNFNSNNINATITKLNSKIDENEIIISKLKFDKKNLQMKLDEANKSHEKELKLMLNYKNSELSVYQKAIDKFKKQISNKPNIILNDDNNNYNINFSNNINYLQKMTEYENKISTLSNELNIFSLEKKKLLNKINTLQNNLMEKDNTINTLNKKIIETEGNFNLKLLEMQQFSDENKDELDQIVSERDELLKKNQELSSGLINFGDKVKEANLIFINKTQFYNKSLDAYKNKIKDYKNKITILKRKVNELYLVIEKMKLNNHNFRLNPVFNNFHKNLVSTPGVYRHNRGEMTPFTKRFFRDKDNISLYNMNKKSNISVLDNEININNLSHSINGIKNTSNFLDNGNGQSNLGDTEDKLEYDQKQYLEHFKSFLSKLDNQFSQEI